MNQEILELEYEVEYRQFREVWLGHFKKSLPNLLTFWGLGILLSLFTLFFFEDRFFGTLMLSLFVSIPLLIVFFGYTNFMKAARNNFSALSPEDRIVRLTFRQGADGFDSRNGKNFSHTAWTSLSGVEEYDACFVFSRAGNIYYIPKSAFRSESEIGFLRFLITTNVEKGVKLLK
jgi:hypothetical protein